jgi:uncharacterized membrane protein
MHNISTQFIFSALVLVAGIVDAIKYRWERDKIIQNKSSKNVSRKFAVAAILADLVILSYTFYILDVPLIIIRFLALYTMIELYFAVYNYYPYKGRALRNFKRPSLFKFTINALIPNRLRKRL